MTQKNKNGKRGGKKMSSAACTVLALSSSAGAVTLGPPPPDPSAEDLRVQKEVEKAFAEKKAERIKFEYPQTPSGRHYCESENTEAAMAMIKSDVPVPGEKDSSSVFEKITGDPKLAAWFNSERGVTLISSGGSFGNVYKYWQKNHYGKSKSLSLKIVKVDKSQTREHFYPEWKISREACFSLFFSQGSPGPASHVVKTYEVWRWKLQETPEIWHYMLVQELYAMDLFDWISENQEKKERISPETFLDVSRQLIQALVYLHGLNIAHRDVKPENIFLNLQGGDGPSGLKLVLGDFDWASSANGGGGGDNDSLWVDTWNTNKGVKDWQRDLWPLGLVQYLLLGQVKPGKDEEMYIKMARWVMSQREANSSERGPQSWCDKKLEKSAPPFWHEDRSIWSWNPASAFSFLEDFYKNGVLPYALQCEPAKRNLEKLREALEKVTQQVKEAERKPQQVRGTIRGRLLAKARQY
ncbi:unnamed protein product [Amoebophrya sp. A25]|nr:unnamed protein product [Amoebophrya sp. A25]|eukprot:GSA25T00012001001.1